MEGLSALIWSAQCPVSIPSLPEMKGVPHRVWAEVESVSARRPGRWRVHYPVPVTRDALWLTRAWAWGGDPRPQAGGTGSAGIASLGSLGAGHLPPASHTPTGLKGFSTSLDCGTHLTPLSAGLSELPSLSLFSCSRLLGGGVALQLPKHYPLPGAWPYLSLHPAFWGCSGLC